VISIPERRSLRARDVMTKDPTVVHREDDAEQVLALLDRHDFNAVPVVDQESQLLGVVTKLSLLRLLSRPGAIDPAEAADPSRLQVRDVMDSRKVWVYAADDVEAVIRQMTRHRVRSVPVVERSGSLRRLVGMVSRGDLFRGSRNTP
jgi:CBS domain-containing protein